MENEKYYLGLDVGTDSVGWAVTDTNYKLLRYKGELMWGVHTFDAGENAEERRQHRSARRIQNHKRRRVRLLEELFAKEIGEIDSTFFIRRKESRLFKDDEEKYRVLPEKDATGCYMTDEAYHERYPTIHHLIYDLMYPNSEDFKDDSRKSVFPEISEKKIYDPRLVFIACSWLVTHRGHFLFESDNFVSDFEDKYNEFLCFAAEYAKNNNEVDASEWAESPWTNSADAPNKLQRLINEPNNSTKELSFNGNFPIKKIEELLKAKKPIELNNIFPDCSVADKISLGMDDEKFDKVISKLDRDDDREFLFKLRELFTCAKSCSYLDDGSQCVSEKKIKIYEQHRKDLKDLKYFGKKYKPEEYKNIKNLDRQEFSKKIESIIQNIKPVDEDKQAFADMQKRLNDETFLPKQVNSDNRIIPQQLYRVELEIILENASEHLDFLNESDKSGKTVKEKILSIFDYKIPYYVGPLHKTGTNNAWFKKQEGKETEKILPWNWQDVIDEEKSEQAFIRRMTNHCTYLPDEDVLPANSLLYEEFCVLDKINNIKIDGCLIDNETKRELYDELFKGQSNNVTIAKIKEWLKCKGKLDDNSEISGIEPDYKGYLKSYHIFKKMLESRTLNEKDVEEIIQKSAYSQSKSRLKNWLKEKYNLADSDCNYISNQRLNGFGRFSGKLLDGIKGKERDSDDPTERTIIEFMRAKPVNHNELLSVSDKYTFIDEINERRDEFYGRKATESLNELLDDMYVSGKVKRQIIRTMDIVSDVVRAKKNPPAKIFVEMARGNLYGKKGKPDSRKDTLTKLYESIKNDDNFKQYQIDELEKELEHSNDYELQSKKLYLYYMQLGRCAYCGKKIELDDLFEKRGEKYIYDIDHIYPRSKRGKDDSPIKNLVLVHSTENGKKSDDYPVPEEFQEKPEVKKLWNLLKQKGLMSAEKYYRLTRKTPFTEDEKRGFINRQLVEVRQSTKVVKDLLEQNYPKSEIVCVKAGLVSGFRNGFKYKENENDTENKVFKLPKSRLLNDLHHAKDAYLNIAVGNVYYEKFTKPLRLDFNRRKNSFRQNDVQQHKAKSNFDFENYNLKLAAIFTHVQRASKGSTPFWNGKEDLEVIKNTMQKNAVHSTEYAYCKDGKLFDENPLSKKENLYPLKRGLDPKKYGGYEKQKISFFVLVGIDKQENGKYKEITLVPIPITEVERFEKNREAVTVEQLHKIQPSTKNKKIDLLLDGRKLKIHTVISLDGWLFTLKNYGDERIEVSPMFPLILEAKWEEYIMNIERTLKKCDKSSEYKPDKEKNEELYSLLLKKLADDKSPFSKLPFKVAYNDLSNAQEIDQLKSIKNVLESMKIDKRQRLSINLSNWRRKHYKDVRIIDQSASGLFEKRSENLLDLLEGKKS